MSKKIATVIIPAKDAAATISACLIALRDQSLARSKYEIIVVDDGSQDNTGTLAAHLGAQVITQSNAGPAAARNAGIQAASGQFVAFTDADCVPSPRWLEHLLAAIYLDGEAIGAKGTYNTQQANLVARFVQLEYESKYERMRGLERIDFIDTYSAIYSRQVLIDNGGFDESFPVPSVEDQELSFRLARKGYKMVFAPEARVTHQHDLTLIEYFRRKFGIGYWKAYLLKWLPEKAIDDSHTLPSQKVQIVLLAFGLVCVSAIPLFPPAYLLAAACFILFFLTATRFLLLTARRDPLVLFIAPLQLIVRALGLGLGLAIGLVAHQSRRRPIHQLLSPFQQAAKRAIDIIGSLCGLVLSSPVILLGAIAIKLDSPGPAFFRQERVGQNGSLFDLVKLRTMVPDAESKVSEVLTLNKVKGPAYKIANDPRVTRVGRFLRRWSLDELPQFWNVVRGEMSLVGPRPEERWVVEQYNDRQRLRLAVKPGMTGPMQVAGRGDLDFEDRLRLELEYIDNYSLLQDMRILLRTLPSVINGRGAY